jgi:hypothetical protein
MQFMHQTACFFLIACRLINLRSFLATDASHKVCMNESALNPFPRAFTLIAELAILMPGKAEADIYKHCQEPDRFFCNGNLASGSACFFLRAWVGLHCSRKKERSIDSLESSTILCVAEICQCLRKFSSSTQTICSYLTASRMAHHSVHGFLYSLNKNSVQ